MKELFTEWLETHTPTKASHVLNLIRGAREGKLYDPQFGTRMRGTGQYAEMLERRFEVARRRFGLDNKSAPLEVARFRVPARPGDQMTLFE